MPGMASGLLIGLLLFLAIVASPAEARYPSIVWRVTKFTDKQNNVVYAINGKHPGPTIEAQRGDKIRVIVTNGLGEAVAIRFPILDQAAGPPCGRPNGFISPGSTCSYVLDAKEMGEYKYQSMFKAQRDSGLNGLIVVS